MLDIHEHTSTLLFWGPFLLFCIETVKNFGRIRWFFFFNQLVRIWSKILPMSDTIDCVAGVQRGRRGVGRGFGHATNIPLSFPLERLPRIIEEGLEELSQSAKTELLFLNAIPQNGSTVCYLSYQHLRNGPSYHSLKSALSTSFHFDPLQHVI